MSITDEVNDFINSLDNKIYRAIRASNGDAECRRLLKEHAFKVQKLPIHSVSDCFSFARYLNGNFHYFDNTDVGDVYKDNDGQGIYSEKDIYDEWLNNR